MAIELGPAKSVDDITRADVLKNPIWLWTWETGQEVEPGQDETWQQPVLNTTDVTAEMAEPIITYRVSGTHVIGSASYQRDRNRLVGLSVWSGDRWTTLKDSSFTAPIRLIAVPSIDGEAGVEFLCDDFRRDEARRVT